MVRVTNKVWTVAKFFLSIVGVLFLALTVLIKVFGFGEIGASEKEVLAGFEKDGIELPVFSTVDTSPGKIRLVRGGQGVAPLVFIHGSPGDWTAFSDFLRNKNIADNFSVFFVDRPGFGESNPGEAVASLEEQARRITYALKAQEVRANLILIGHSLGGPVAARIAADNPKLIKGLILVAPSMDPELEKIQWFNKLAQTHFFSGYCRRVGLQAIERLCRTGSS